VNRIAFLTLLVVLCASLFGQTEVEQSGVVQVTPFGSPVGQMPLIAARNNRLYLFDDRTNRLFICESSGRVLKITGSIGDGPGQFFKPSAMVTSPHSVVIYDRGNNRIVTLTLEGDFKSQFGVNSQLYNVAAGNDDTIYINDPSSGYLITALDASGRVLRKIGELTSLSTLYHTQDKTRDDRLRLTANRVRLATDNSGHIFAVFIIAPVLREYSHDGSLIKEVTFDAESSGKLKEILWHKDPNIYMTSGIVDGNQVPYLVKDAAVDPVTNNLVVLTALSKLLIFDSECNETAILEIKGVLDWQIWKMAVEDRSLWLVRVFLPGSFHGTIPQTVQAARLKAKRN
jgi:hypothetical protein